ncbi:MAG: CDP-alcohol phosphatidyltransferase family protein [Methanocellales archaeon]|nr:CDP-alcohol phosphatidyltransferase family protein [Methanocellales archaeon]MDD3291281.1 CDP-alcohol phosphatidyltransferase family protein [Methanocellales archaeon]MDD5235453.1 CDP-alcohol phosphatidyltransferase family protein [Methanocellales archaeon]MDD5484464.1 CDP-alcohol phosphatidyltransferase family protein [Methanocellales archaeon]
MTLESFRPFFRGLIDPIASALEDLGAGPNSLSVASLFFAALAGISLYFRFLFLAGLMVFLNAASDALDGALARRIGTADLRGDFLDHVIDRYADIFIVCGIFFGGYAPWQIGVAAITGVLLTSYLGTQAQAVNIGRYYGGILGRADRLVVIFIAIIANSVYSEDIYGLPLLGWVLLLIAITSHFTAIQRFIRIWQELSK